MVLNEQVFLHMKHNMCWERAVLDIGTSKSIPRSKSLWIKATRYCLNKGEKGTGTSSTDVNVNTKVNVKANVNTNVCVYNC